MTTLTNNLALGLWRRSEGRYRRHPAIFQGQVLSGAGARTRSTTTTTAITTTTTPQQQQQQRQQEQEQQWSISPAKQIHSQDRCVESLDIHPSESSRYLLTGSRDGICSVYDLSSRGFEEVWQQQPSQTGANYYHANEANIVTSLAAPRPQRVYKPVARSTAATTTTFGNTNSPQHHQQQQQQRLGPTLQAQWYSVDTGAFVSGHPTQIAVWDTNEMVPVVQISPFASEQHHTRRYSNTTSDTGRYSNTTSDTGSAATAPMSLSCMHLSTGLPNLVATGSYHSSMIKLVDIRTGAASHSLLSGGNRAGDGSTNAGIRAVQWSPVQPHILASGSASGQVRLWDIRKAGRNAWLVECLDPEMAPPDPTVSRAFWPDLSHLKEVAQQRQRKQKRESATKRQSSNETKRSKRSANQQTPLRLRLQLHQQSRVKQQNQPRGLNDYSATRDHVQSHKAAIDALAFDPCGQYLVSHGAHETNLKCWDLRDAGQLLPRRYDLAPVRGKSATTTTSTRMKITTSPRNHRNKAIEDALIYITQGTNVAGFSLHQGGPPVLQLKGHMGSVRDFCTVPDNACEILTSAEDGLILAWEPDSNSSNRRTNGTGRTVDQDTW